MNGSDKLVARHRRREVDDEGPGAGDRVGRVQRQLPPGRLHRHAAGVEPGREVARPVAHRLAAGRDQVSADLVGRVVGEHDVDVDVAQQDGQVGRHRRTSRPRPAPRPGSGPLPPVSTPLELPAPARVRPRTCPRSVDGHAHRAPARSASSEHQATRSCRPPRQAPGPTRAPRPTPQARARASTATGRRSQCHGTPTRRTAPSPPSPPARGGRREDHRRPGARAPGAAPARCRSRRRPAAASAPASLPCGVDER